MNEPEKLIPPHGAEHIDPALKAAGWGVVEGSRIRREYPIAPGRIEGHGKRGKALTADYVLEYRNTKLGVVEAKALEEELTEGVGQAKNYGSKLAVRYVYSTNGRGIYQVDMSPPSQLSTLNCQLEKEVPRFPTPDELWAMTFPSTRSGTGDAADKASELAASELVELRASELVELWRYRFAAIPFEDKGGSHPSRYYQDTSVDRVMQAIGAGLMRILLTLATGTGKTFIAFQIAWKLFHARWNLAARSLGEGLRVRASWERGEGLRVRAMGSGEGLGVRAPGEVASLTDSLIHNSQLLSDIRQIFTQSGATRLSSKQLIEALQRLPSGRYSGLGTPHYLCKWLARTLNPLGIKPHTLRLGQSRVTGYDLAEFTVAFSRLDQPESPEGG